MSLEGLCNTAWMGLCYREGRAFSRAATNVRRAQEEVLFHVVNKNKDTWFGRRHCFGYIRSASDFQRAVPLTTYEDYRDAIDRIGDGELNVLTAEPVCRFVPTSGTTTGEKLIPYTATLRRCFQRAIRAWIWDLFLGRPSIRRGRAYWSVSPLTAAGRTSRAGIPIGFDDDAYYLGAFEQALVRRTMAVPAGVALRASVATSQYATLFYLLRADDLSLVSVWSPTFFTALINVLEAKWPRLCDDIERGIISVDADCEHSLVTRARLRPLPRRANLLRAVFAGSQRAADWMPQVWPRLAILSCWADGPSAAYARELRTKLGGIEVQAKGLLATEAFISIPRVAQVAPALAVHSHFFEFQPAGSMNETSAPPLFAHELQAGREYRVVVTNGGGLYRYQLQDQVLVVGFEKETPLLRFVGKADSTCDLVGEKLNAAHVQSALDDLFQEFGLRPKFARLVAESAARPRYLLQLSEPEIEIRSELIEKIRDAVERRLYENPGYAYARKLGQLSRLGVELVNDEQAAALTNEFLDERLRAGRRLGDIKLPTLVMGNRSHS
jgi:hypothetical protein